MDKEKIEDEFCANRVVVNNVRNNDINFFFIVKGFILLLVFKGRFFIALGQN